MSKDSLVYFLCSRCSRLWYGVSEVVGGCPRCGNMTDPIVYPEGCLRVKDEERL